MTRFAFFVLWLIFGTAFAQESRRGEDYAGAIPLRDPSYFSDDSRSDVKPERQRRSIFIQLNANALFASLNDWKNQLVLSDGTHPSSICTVFGVELGSVINNYIQIGIGTELFFSPSVDAVAPSPNLVDQITGSFFYGSLRAGSFLESTPELYIFGGADVGTLKATESLENYYAPNSERTGSAFAYRLKGGAQYYLLDNWSIAVEAGYLVGNINNVTNQPNPHFALNLSGIELRFAVNYHIPF